MRFETLGQWLAWLDAGHTARIELGLGRVAEVLQRLDLGKPEWPLITVAGTNGKGSSVAFLEAILSAAGNRVGVYTSPHLLRYNERVRIGGEAIADQALCESFARVDEARGEIELTYFEFGTLAAIVHFVQAAPDVVILEVGLGGRLDACNVLDADVALVTRIGLDHLDWLGPDRDSIAREKAGIFRPQRPAVCGDPDPPKTIAEEAARIGTPLYQSGRDFHFEAGSPGWNWWCTARRYNALPLPGMPGVHQIANAAAALMVLERLAGRLPVGQSAIRDGLATASIPGRYQVIPGTPELILDVAHNPQAAAAVAALLRDRPCGGETHVVLAMLEDKDTTGFIAALAAVTDQWHLAGLPVPRGLAIERLRERFVATGRNPSSASNSVPAALQCARDRAGKRDRILICGSFHTVAEILRGHV